MSDLFRINSEAEAPRSMDEHLEEVRHLIRHGVLVEVVIDYAALALILDDIFRGNEQHHSATDVMNAALEGDNDE